MKQKRRVSVAEIAMLHDGLRGARVSVGHVPIRGTRMHGAGRIGERCVTSLRPQQSSFRGQGDVHFGDERRKVTSLRESTVCCWHPVSFLCAVDGACMFCIDEDERRLPNVLDVSTRKYVAQCLTRRGDRIKV